ncbi:MAG: hypothetical protein J5I92_14835, partial [Thiogranum sp.]|nr:hypothetical protein [Thiogranum sp.]
SFIPRAFSITHVNLTHRNWTAVGLPDCEDLPIVDPRGLLTPLYDSWSLDGWVIGDNGRVLLPSRESGAVHRFDMADGVAVQTETTREGMKLANRAWVEHHGERAICRMQLEAGSDKAGWLVVALRPYNAEGISFIHQLALSADRRTWHVDEKQRVEFSAAADRHHISDYRNGDVYLRLRDLQDQQSGECDIGMVTAAAMFRLEAGRARTVTVSVSLPGEDESEPPPEVSWKQALNGHCRLQLPDERMQFLYDAALRTLVLHSPGDVYPGPYTYKRFWFRDAAFIIHGLLCAGLVDRAERALDRFPARQTVLGYFHSQEGEWDANGEVLWIMRRFCELTGRDLKPEWHKALVAGARWIVRKRLADNGDSPHSGLLPAGFSAEHLGPNDYYYWDDFWGVAGLRDAAVLCARQGDNALHDEFLREADAFRETIDRSLAAVATRLGRPGMPASPYRRLDAGSIGSIVAGYPLQLHDADDPRLLDTAEFLLQNCFVDDGFFQDMIHSGINAYLTLHVAQVLLRAGDARCFSLITRVAELASPTGQWPEAIHPRTLGGCMGDGQHVWAAAEWVLMVRNCFVREEGDRLVLVSGLMRQWLEAGEAVFFGPAPTAFGSLSITASLTGSGAAQQLRVAWTGDWRAAAPTVEIRVPGCAVVIAGPGETSVDVAADQFK